MDKFQGAGVVHTDHTCPLHRVIYFPTAPSRGLGCYPNKQRNRHLAATPDVCFVHVCPVGTRSNG